MAAAIRVLAVCGHRGARVGRPFRSYRQASVRTRAAGARVRVRNRTTAKFSGLAPNTRSQFNFQPKPVIRPRQPARPAGPKSPRTSLVRGRCRGLSGQAAGRRPVGRGPQGQTGSGKAVDPSHGGSKSHIFLVTSSGRCLFRLLESRCKHRALRHKLMYIYEKFSLLMLYNK